MTKILLVLFVLYINILHAVTDDEINHISNSQYWHILLHLRNENTSDIVDPDFFMSKPFTPRNELVANIEALNSSDRNEILCRFPARYRYISEQTKLELSFEHCENFQIFLKDSSGESASIGFASPYLDSPMSYFGHSYIKINKPNNIYFSQTISFAAEIPKDVGFFELAYKGIGGGFIGRYVAAPYFKLNESYTMIEQRSLSEYKLDLTKKEINRMLWHLYEIYDMDVDYKFFTENCAYELLWMLEAARPTIHLRDQFKNYVIPYETITAIKENNMVEKITTEPSTVERLYRTYYYMNDEEKNMFERLKQDSNKSAALTSYEISSESRDHLAYMINGYYDMMFKKFNIVKSDYNKVKKLRYTPPIERYDGEPKRSGSTKLETSFLHGDLGDGIGLTIKPLLFNRIEDINSQINESTLEFLTLEARRFNNNTKLERFDLFNIESITKRFDFYHPPSWKIRAGADRRLKSGKLSDVAQVAAGVAYGTPNIMLYIMGQLSVYPSEATAGTDTLIGISWWIDNFHVGIDYDIPLLYTAEKAEYNFRYYLLTKEKYNIRVKFFGEIDTIGASLIYNF